MLSVLQWWTNEEHHLEPFHSCKKKTLNVNCVLFIYSCYTNNNTLQTWHRKMAHCNVENTFCTIPKQTHAAFEALIWQLIGPGCFWLLFLEEWQVCSKIQRTGCVLFLERVSGGIPTLSDSWRVSVGNAAWIWAIMVEMWQGTTAVRCCRLEVLFLEARLHLFHVVLMKKPDAHATAGCTGLVFQQ